MSSVIIISFIVISLFFVLDSISSQNYGTGGTSSATSTTGTGGTSSATSTTGTGGTSSATSTTGTGGTSSATSTTGTGGTSSATSTTGTGGTSSATSTTGTGGTSSATSTTGTGDDVQQPSSSGRGKPISFITLTSYSNLSEIKRGNNIKIGYIITAQKSDVDLADVDIKIPKDFSNIAFSESKFVDTKAKENPYLFHLKGILHLDKTTEISYIAEIPLSAKISDYHLSDYFAYKNKKTDACILKVRNNPPVIDKFEFEGLDCKGQNHYLCHRGDNISLSYRVIDRENDGITCNITSNNSQYSNLSYNAYYLSIPYSALSPGFYEFHLLVNDKDKDKDDRLIYLEVSTESVREDFLKNFPTKIMNAAFIILTLFIFFKLFLCELNGRKEYLMRLNRELIWNTANYGMPLLSILFIPYSAYKHIDFINFVFCLYLILLIFSICFLELNFSSAESNNIKRSYNHIRKYWNCIKGMWLTLIVIFGMSIAVLLVGYRLPLNFIDVSNDMRFNFIFFYYTALIQLFGTILSIVAMFTIWYLQERKSSWNKSEIINKIKNFMFLYISEILISIGGLTLAKIPPLDIVNKVDSLETAMSIFTFEASMLLIIPAMAALFRLAVWFMDSNSKKEESPWFLAISDEKPKKNKQ